VVLTGSGADRELLEHIARLAGVTVLNLAGKLSLLELAALIRRLDLYITVDSGPAHMAAALGTPLITLWGPAILEQTAPLPGSGPVRIIRHPVHCAPCYGTPLMKTCQDNICMKGISLDEVLAAAQEMLGSPEAEQRSTIRPQPGLRPRA
jgi:ADP-heptose:LPS heptosyltransferase